ncbi:MAG TPA: phosphoribosylformylglycinamidine cyclo-ligase [Ktedonobacteraceae bacterium]|nr:phosphoribosylformylglycinamidine cyclo-ligase [Ktedonobacteraceae bacterium]
MRALVLRAPGINRDRDAAYACRLAGFTTDLLHINQLIKAPETLLHYYFLVVPGGFSYGDDLGAGNLLAKNLTIHLGGQLQRFIDEGRPVLGICNGFQVLVRAGLLPGSIEEETQTSTPLRATLTENDSAQFECRWVTLVAQPSACIFTRGIDRPIEVPVAHGEGQFVFSGDIVQLQANGQVSLVYATPAGRHGVQQVSYPDNPNGSIGNIAGICNARGNVFGLMPHPENYVHGLQHPQRRALSNGQGDGLLLFQNAYTYAQQFVSTTSVGTSFSTSTDNGSQAEPVSSPAGDPKGTPAASSSSAPADSASVYAQSGVNIAAADYAKRLMTEAVQETQGPAVLAGMGAFAGVLSVQSLQKMKHPALVSSMDSVGTKTLLAAQSGRLDTIGYDIVNHCVNDMLAQGGKPLFFMDYLAVNKLDPVQAATIVRSVANACAEASCTLLGGETAQMPDVYLPGTFDLAGTIVGVVEADEMIDGATIRAGDVLLGLPSNGLHTNGYSLARRVFAPYTFDTVFPELGESIIDALLRPHRCYLREIAKLREYLADRGRYIKGIAHITGGGFEGNISRILPAGTQANIKTQAWNVPPLFQLIARLGNVAREEMYQTFNMGIGMVLVLSPKVALEARCVLPELLTIGSITEGEGVIVR